MASASTTAALRQMTHLFTEGTLSALGDDRLLDRFLDRRDEDAFAAIVARHGSMVLATCLGILRESCDAEDAFQATFLTLVRRGRSIRGRDCIGGWLRKVARRASVRINADRKRRQQREAGSGQGRLVGGQVVWDAVENGELKQVLTHEINRLPEVYRASVMLCLVEGISQPEAAGRLAVTEGVVRGRLARARALLRDRLKRRGVSPEETTLHIPSAWIGNLLAAARVAKLGHSSHIIWMNMITKVVLTVIMLVGLICIAAGTPQTPTEVQPPPPLENAPKPRAIALVAPIPEKPAADEGRTVVFRGKVLGPDGKGVAGATLFIATDAWADANEVGKSGAEGSYQIVLPETAFQKNFSGGNSSPRLQAALLATAGGFGAGWQQLKEGQRDGKPAMNSEYVQDIKLVPDYPIEGRVVDLEGKPVANAVVALRSISAFSDDVWHKIIEDLKKGTASFPWDMSSFVYPRGAWAKFPKATSDADGRFRMTGLGKNRRVELIADGLGIRPAEFTLITRDDVTDLTRNIREKNPRTRDSNGVFYTNYNTPVGVRHAVMLFDPRPIVAVERGRTVSGVVRNARTREPIVGMKLVIEGGLMTMVSDANGRFHGAQGNNNPTLRIFAMSYEADRYLSAIREFTDLPPTGDITADFDIDPGVLVTGRVLEAGTNKPIVSATRTTCHDLVGTLVAGMIYYMPLASNDALRGTPTGLAFSDVAHGWSKVSNWIDGEGRFRIVVPPGPGVLLVEARPGTPFMSEMMGVWNEDTGLHKAFPYLRLKERYPNDGAFAGVLLTMSGLVEPMLGVSTTLPGFAEPISVTKYHAYRIINPASDAHELAVDFALPRAPTRLLKFVDPKGRPVNGLTLKGLLVDQSMAISMAGSEVEALGIDAAVPRSLEILSNDQRLCARETLGSADADATRPRIITLQPTSSVSGRLGSRSK